ncbi:TadE/TadG family type IV pilus assembly protein [Comamonas terrigena]|jgi:Flp pilus assembly protein TadG|uniref:TadE/TadG family type IV pilus assembly protein n=1 Tax=Comamonas terrigena TaxID=32013 RepID=UPI0024482897|nr:TadE/TadG family type IV pilus assembly protein [Comamonas terrigena]MDH0048071.1 pilus assembly protein [Comamonas terrigena]MDH0510329.1 pilus assembly protein [Comamonas terrigena]MDH1089931.1 pilus assembly protein [Comamonas terrigena]MDH1291833.1 pilus assembly protein [Comamonas terrigena]MDH1499803.1 pilus assembly protein [Comamonas terrigena]
MRAHHRQQGVELVELALILPFLILLSMLVVEFGRALYEYNTVAKSVRDAVRYLSVQLPNTNCAQAQNLVVYGKTTAGTTPLARGLTTGSVTCSWQTAGTYPLINTVTVTVNNYRFQFMTASVFGLKLGDANDGLTLSNIAATMRTQT